MTRLSHKRTLLTALLSGTLAFSPVLSTAQYAFAEPQMQVMGNASSLERLLINIDEGTATTLTGKLEVNEDIPVKNERNSFTLTFDAGSGITFLGGHGFVVEDGCQFSIHSSDPENKAGIESDGAVIRVDKGTCFIDGGRFVNTSGEPLRNYGSEKTFYVKGGLFSKTSFDTLKPFCATGYSPYGSGASDTFMVRSGEGGKAFKSVAMEDTFEYNGSRIIPTVTVIGDDDKVLQEKVDYTISNSGDSVNAGTKTMTIKGINAYEGYSDAQNWTITPKTVKLSAPNKSSYFGEIAEGEKFSVTYDGLISGHKFSSEPQAVAEIDSAGYLADTYKLVIKTSDLKVVDADGYDVTKNYKFECTDGTLTVYDLSDYYYDYDYGYVDYTDLYLSNATVTLTADPAPYKSSGYRDRDNIKSVVVNGIDVTSRCEYSYSGNADPGSTVTVTITPSNSFYNNTNTYRSAATPSNSNTSSTSSSNTSNNSVTKQSIGAASEDGVALSAMAENEEQIAIVANELPEIVAQAYHSGLYPSGSDYYDMLYWLMTNSGANSSYYTDLSRYLYGNYGILNLGNYIGTNGNASLLNLINRYYRGGYYGNWYNGYYNNGYYNNGNFFDYNNRTYRLTGSKTVTFKISDSNSTVTVSANNVTKRQGDPDPVLTATILGVNESDKSKINYTISRVQGETPGTYAINVTGATEQNGYKVTFVPGTLTITAATAGTDVAGGAITAGTGTTATTPAVLPTSPATVAATTSANKLAATGDNTFLGYGVLALVGVAVVALGVFFNHRKKDGE